MTAPDGGAARHPETLHGAPVTWSRGQPVVHPTPERYLDIVGALRDDGYVLCIDVTAVDYLTDPYRDLPEGVVSQRFEIVVNLVDMDSRRRLRVRLQVAEHTPAVPSLFELYPGTEAMEREVYDMFGIAFHGHPDLTRVLMPDHWEGHPLRKDYAVGRIPVQFKGAPGER